MNHFVSASCEGERCALCGKPATHKVGEELQWDDPMPNRHNLTAYVCCAHFRAILGPAVPCPESDQPSIPDHWKTTAANIVAGVDAINEVEKGRQAIMLLKTLLASDRPSPAEPDWWLVLDESGLPDHATLTRQMAQDHINDALTCGNDDAAFYKAIPIFKAPPALDRSSKDMVRHAEGGIYEHIGTAQPAGTATAGEHLEMYRGQDGRLWWRFQDDFADRFTPLDHPSNAGDE